MKPGYDLLMIRPMLKKHTLLFLIGILLPFITYAQEANACICPSLCQLAPPLTLITLPVVIHIVNEDSDAYSDADVAESIKILDDAFSTGIFESGRPILLVKNAQSIRQKCAPMWKAL